MGGRMKELVDALFRNVPTGVGAHRRDLRLSASELRKILMEGARAAVSSGRGEAADLDHIEERGTIPGADPDLVSERAVERGRPQLGTLGSGNHFLEVDRVDEIFHEEAARAFGLALDQVAFVIHTGSPGLGYHALDDLLQGMLRAAAT